MGENRSERAELTWHSGMAVACLFMIGGLINWMDVDRGHDTNLILAYGGLAGVLYAIAWVLRDAL